MMVNQSESALANAIPEGIVVLDANHKIQWYNKSAAGLLTLDDQAISLPFSGVIGHPKLIEIFNTRSLKTLEINSPHDPHLRLSIRWRPYTGEQSIVIIQDVTHTYRLEAIRQVFVANVSHELRTPLTVLHGYLEILLSQPSIDKDKLLDILQQMSGQTQRMEQMVEDLLLLSRLEGIEPDISAYIDVPVTPLLNSIKKDAMTLSAGAHRIDLTADEDLTVRGQPDELRSAFSNLVYNAVRYTPDGGHIHVRWYRSDQGACFEVEDDGVGIAQKHLSRITQRFYRVDKSRLYKGQGGTGLGLAIVKHVLLRHEVDLEIQSQLGRGSVFKIVFPVIR